MIREKLSGEWWGDNDREDVADAMTYELAIRLGTPGVNWHSEASFPGIEGVRLDGWSLDRSQDIAVAGQLDRVNAPRLPWVDGISHVRLVPYRSESTIVNVYDEDSWCTCDPRPPRRSAPRWYTRNTARLREALLRQPHLLAVVTRPPRCEPLCPTRIDPHATEAQRTAMEQAVRDAIGSAWQAGKNEEECKSSETSARDYIASADHEFTSDGELY